MKVQTAKIYQDASWDFRTANTKYATHCFHAYPAMMIPQVAARILEEYAPTARVLFDPYCGTGTSLVEASIRGMRAFATDLNPLARLLTQGKTTPLHLQVLDLYLKQYADFTFGLRFGIEQQRNLVVPDFPNRDFWFRPSEQVALAYIKQFIDNIQEPAIAQFFQIAFSETVRDSSLTKKGEFKLVRMPDSQWERFAPNVFGIMEAKLSRNRKGLQEYMSHERLGVVTVHDFNTAEGIPPHIFSEEIDAVVTSPPYGDSSTTVAYGQFSRLSLQWLGIEEAGRVDKKLMGNIRLASIPQFDYKPLDTALQAIAEQDVKRATEVAAFYLEYEQSIRHVTATVRRDGLIGYVVGNRRVKGSQLPTDKITAEFFSRNGCEHIATIIRSIPNKRMPSKNSPTNIPGIIDSTMHQEFIVIAKKIV
jgi:hypothetical protein